MANLKMSELGLMSVPALLLAGIGFALRGRPHAPDVAPDQPFKLVVEKVAFEPVTPREVADGNDTKVKVVLSHQGPEPKWWRTGLNSVIAVDPLQPRSFVSSARAGSWLVGSVLTYQWGNTTKVFSGCVTSNPLYHKDLDRYVAHYPLPVARVPDKIGPVTFKTTIGAGLDPPVPISVIVRRLRQRVRPPAVSTESWLTLASASVGPVARVPGGSAGLNAGFNTEVDVALKYRGPSSNPTWQTGVIQLVDQTGHNYRMSSYSQTDDDNAATHAHSIIYRFSLPQIPASAGTIRFKTKISANDRWPVPVSVVVRTSALRPLDH